ncbi:MAG: Alpha/beta hydrolase family [Rhodobacteraceae bacterium HLUCCA08]|nr:MAG: Alpha/beta hydrolase family [Rhodobacteraceae bacterium HLUCCA08]
MAALSRAEAERARLAALLGPDWPGPGLADIACRATTRFGGWIREDLALTDAAGEVVPAWFLRPPDGAAPVPAVLYVHAHGNAYGIGRSELFDGRPMLRRPYAEDLVQAGLAVLCLDLPGFGARAEPGESARAKAALWRGGTLLGRMLAELRAGIDLLAAHPLVRADRIGALGASMGSTLAFWLAALDPRLRATAALCSLADLEMLIDSGAHDGHGIYMMVPGLTRAFRTGQIAGLAAPRALLIGAGMADWSTPPEAFARARADLEAAYAAAGAAPALAFVVDAGAGHEETPEMRAAVLDLFARDLADG